ncbi:MAG TPA: histidine kinase, partial [Roseiflexaceae bacterium]|nr:histidine kinase [Roseiflexaceae bacterium]
MFSGLRLRLTLLYLLAALALIVLLGVGTYWLLSSYFRTTTDLALQHKLAHEFVRLGARPPPELAAADLAWYTNRGRLLPDPPATPPHDEGAEPQEAEHDRRSPADDIDDEESFDGELAAIFVLS